MQSSRSSPASSPQIAPVRRTRRQARRAYDRMSASYDGMAWRWEQHTIALGLDLLDAQPGERILEIGCGTGHSLATLAGYAGATGRVTGLDLSPGMLGRSQRVTGHLDQAGLVCGDGLHTPFITGAFDAVFMSSTLELSDTPEIPRLLAECRRVLRTTGRLGVVAMAREGGFPGMVALYELVHRWFPDMVDCRPIYPLQTLQSAGFRVMDQRKASLFGLPVEAVVASPS